MMVPLREAEAGQKDGKRQKKPVCEKRSRYIERKGVIAQGAEQRVEHKECDWGCTTR